VPKVRFVLPWASKRLAVAVCGLFVLLAPAAAPALSLSARGCERTITSRLARCFAKVSRIANECYLDSAAACPPGRFDRDRLRLFNRIHAHCDAGDFAELGYAIGVDGLVQRVQEACVGDATTLAARSFGGPQAVLLAAPTAGTRSCVGAAAEAAAGAMRRAYLAQSSCLRRAHRGGTCDAARAAAKVAAARSALIAAADGACADLDSLIGLDSATYADHALTQVRCMLAASHADAAPFAGDCGPRAAVPVPPRGEWTRVVLPEAEWGTRCGDGSSYAFWFRLAPQGSPLQNVIVDLQGGGVCTNESECLAVPSGLFRATDNSQPTGGYRSTDPNINPFWDWTMIALPYCTQDVHAGGGLTNVFPGITVHRFGAVNLRTGVRYLRDVLWQAMDASDPEGYRPDRLRVLFGGVSAGGFGVVYNYHYLLDDLRWVNTTAAPDSALGLSNGNLVGLLGFGIIMNGTISGWGGLPYAPPYCLSSACAVVPFRETRFAPRLKATPYQQFLNLSNQVDTTQQVTTRFSSSALWTNTARQSYCDTRGRNGIHYFLPAISSSTHGMVQNSTRFQTITSDGVSLRDYLAAAMADPDGVVDRVEEGSLASSASIDPFPCSVD
jgi:hypothetical protein